MAKIGEVGGIVSAYDQEVLIPEVGQGNLRDRLLGGLERVMKRVNPKYTPTEDESLLNKKIDYLACYEIEVKLGTQGRVTRLRACLNGANIETYQDLKDYVKQRQVRDIRGIRNLGSATKKLLYAHLHSIDINLFGTDYTPEELSVYNKIPIKQDACYTERQRKLLNKPITYFSDLSVRARNCLSEQRIQTVGQLLEKTERELLLVRNFGKTTLIEIKEKLAREGLSLMC